ELLVEAALVVGDFGLRGSDAYFDAVQFVFGLMQLRAARAQSTLDGSQLRNRIAAFGAHFGGLLFEFGASLLKLSERADQFAFGFDQLFIFAFSGGDAGLFAANLRFELAGLTLHVGNRALHSG